MKAYRAITIILAIIPLFLGITGVIFGADEYATDGKVSAALDSQYRYLAAIYIAVGAMMIYSVLGPPADVKTKANLLRFAMLGWFLGGCARAISWLVVGEPADWQVSGMIGELVIPVLMLFWQRRIVKH